MKNKIAIMTWHTHNNYGTVLQAFALSKVIKKEGYEKVDLIKYEPKSGYQNLFKLLTYKNIKNKLLACNFNIKKKLQEKDTIFNEFRKQYFIYTRECNTQVDLYNLNNEYDKFISGSDQIWAPTVFDENYFLSFVDNNSKKIAYAPSIGLNDIENDIVKNKMSSLIKKYNSLSIREEKGREIIKDLCDVEAQVVLDPTLLLDKNEWNSIFNLDKFEKKDYVLIYCLGNNRNAKKIAKKFAKKYNKDIVLVPTFAEDYFDKNNYNASPVEFLKLIYNASLVITDSFHGTIFSINFNVPFITLKRFKDDVNSQNSRIYNILKIVGGQNRIYKNNIDYFLTNYGMEFEEINKRIDEKRKESKRFLSNALKEENQECNNKKITNQCTGCGMCAAICPQKCIEMKLNNEGFFEYSMDETRCIECDLCKKICGQTNNEKQNLNEMKLYSSHSTDKNVLEKSSSGGIAYEIAKLGIEEDYEIIGCTYDYKLHKAKHIKINSIEDIKLLSGSKYIQSYTKDAFGEISNIKKGIIIGTPCQVASIDNYLKIVNKRENFILVDLICHGVPSYLLWDRFLKTQKEIKEISFRDKSYGWHSKGFTINNKKISKEKNSLFYDFFDVESVYNDACYECNYRASTCADIRIGDFWGAKFKKNNTGISMLIVCSKNGKEFIGKLKEENRINLQEEDIKDYFTVQQIKNIIKPLYYDNLMMDLKREDNTLRQLSDKYCKSMKREKKMKKFIFSVYKKIEGVLNGK